MPFLVPLLKDSPALRKFLFGIDFFNSSSPLEIEGANLIDVFPVLFYPLFLFYWSSLGVGVATLTLILISFLSFDLYFHAFAFIKPYSSTKWLASSDEPKSTIPESESLSPSARDWLLTFLWSPENSSWYSSPLFISSYIWSMLSRLKNFNTLIFLSSIFPSIGNVKTPINVIIPIDIKLMRLIKRLLLFEVSTVLACISSACLCIKLFSLPIPL